MIKKFNPLSMIGRLGLFALIIVVATACGGGNGGNTGGGNAGQAGGDALLASAPSDIQEIYKQNCVSCHGAELEGRVGGNSNLQQVGARKSHEEIANMIINGGGGMRAFKGVLSDEQITGLADWLVTLK